jgi:CubicO group peptidase (beta-lactamase class C family)
MLKSLLFLLAMPVLACQASSSLATDFVNALNQGDDAHLTAFVEKWCTTSLPVKDRVERLKNISSQGAPFKILKVQAMPNSIGLMLQDKNGEQLGIKIDLSPDGKYDRAGNWTPGEDNAPPKDYADWKDLQSLADVIRQDTKNPAMGIAVRRNGVLEQAVSGTRSAAGKDAVGVDEPWSIGSIGKPLCSTVIGRLIEMGKLDWDTTLGEALKDLPMKDGYKDVTLEQIMHHRGGIPADPGMRRPDVDRIVAGEKDSRKIRTNYAKDILMRDPAAKPDTQFIYSNAGYALLGAIAEKVTGKTYEALVRELIFDPLKLKNSYTSEDKLPANRPSGHVRGPEGLQEVNFSGPMEILFAPAGGGMFMSLADLSAFGQAHLDGLRGVDGLLKAATVARLHKGVPEGGPGGMEYACGWGIEAVPGAETMQGHNGSNGTMRAQLGIFPKSNLVVASFVNAGGESEPSAPLQAVWAVAKRYAKQ